jgi:hypothetical protein
MLLDQSTAVIILGVLALAPIGFATLYGRTGSKYPGWGRWAAAGPLLIVALFLLGLRPTAPDWLSMVVATP